MITDYKQFALKLSEFWDILNSVGEKYGPALKEPTTLWKAPNKLHQILFSAGITKNEIDNVLPGNHIKNLLLAHNLL